MIKKLYNRLYHKVYCFFFDIVRHAISPQYLQKQLAEGFRYDTYSIQNVLQQRALEETANFVATEMHDVRSFIDEDSVWAYALENVVDRSGLYLEFGVYKGHSINFIADRIEGNTIYGFDSFEGLPERWFDVFDVGHFQVDDLPSVRPNVELVKGWFDECLPAFVKDHRDKVSFLHIDCDLYSSTKTIFDHLGGQIGEGTIIVFHEYYNYPGWQEGEYKAFMEFLDQHGLAFEYTCYNRRGAQVAVKIIS